MAPLPPLGGLLFFAILAVDGLCVAYGLIREVGKKLDEQAARRNE